MSAPPPPTVADPPDDPSTRGVTRVSPHVVERIASYACTRIDGVARSTDTTTKTPPTRVHADVSGREAHLSITVPTAYAHPVVVVARDIRNAVAIEVQRLCGMQVVGIDIEAQPINQMTRSRVR